MTLLKTRAPMKEARFHGSTAKVLFTVSLLGGAVWSGFFPGAANATVITTPFQFALPSEGERFDLFITYDSSSTQTVTRPSGDPSLLNPGVVTPTNPANPTAVPDGGTFSPTNPAAAYGFTGYVITGITGKRYSNDVYTGDVYWNDPVKTGTNAETVGVFNYYYGGSYPVDTIFHGTPDNLFNPGGLGFVAVATPTLPAANLNNVVSFGGIAFDVFDNVTGNFDEPYQLFTVSKAVTGGPAVGLQPGSYAGCPGSCVKAEPVPGPLPILGLGAAFGGSRRLRNLMKDSKTPV